MKNILYIIIIIIIVYTIHTEETHTHRSETLIYKQTKKLGFDLL